MRDGNDLTSQPRSLLGPVLAGLAAFLVYLLSMAPDLTWANFSSDGGELITASITSGIPHPPGYPTYIFLGKIAALIPIGTVAWRFNFLSAVSAATAVAFITATAQELLPVTKKNQVVAVAGGLCAAFAPLFWGQALVSEVYALNMAILSILLWSLLSGRSSFLSGILLGLATTTHLSSLIMLPLALALSARRRWLHLIAGLLLGLLPFLALPFLARSGSPVIWGDPTTLRGWLWLVSGRIYYANLRLPDPGVFLPRVFQLAGILLRQWLWAGWLIIVLGMTSGLLQKRVILGLVFTALIYFIYGFFYQTEDTILNFIPIILLFSPLLAAGLTRFGVWSLGFPILLLMLNYQSLDLHHERSVRPLAETVLNSAPAEAILLTPGDQSIFTLWYFHHVEGIRQDIYLVDANLFAFDWYREHIKSLYPDLVGLEEDDLETFRRSNSRRRSICDVPAALAAPLSCSAGS